MGAYLLRRLLQLMVVLLVVSTVLFLLLRVSGDPAAMLAGEHATPAEVTQIRHSLGLDAPLPIQYLKFLQGAATLHFGDSIVAHRDAMSMVWERLPNSLALIFASLAFAVVIALPLGTYAAIKRGGPMSGLALLFAFLGQSVPNFWLAILAILVFSVRLRWLPSFGTGDFSHLILPATTLGIAFMAQFVRLMRSSMLEVLGQDYVRTARAKGMSASLVIRRHAIRNGLITIVTVLGTTMGLLISGTILTETIFSWPGLGIQLYQAVTGRDYPVVQASVFAIAIMVVLINLVVDLAYRLLDPRVGLA